MDVINISQNSSNIYKSIPLVDEREQMEVKTKRDNGGLQIPVKKRKLYSSTGLKRIKEDSSVTREEDSSDGRLSLRRKAQITSYKLPSLGR